MATSSKTSYKAFRVVVCAAILTGSLFGRALHELHHKLDHAFQSVAVAKAASPGRQVDEEDAGRCHAHRHAGHGDHAHSVPSQCPAQPAPTGSDGEHEHDAGTCAICYVLGLQLDRSESICVAPAAQQVDEFVALADDAAVEQSLSSSDARGPPVEA